MEGIELVCFKMISALGAAKSCFMEAVQEARLGHFEEARRCIEEGDKYHAEDQLMNAEFLKITAEEIIALYERIESIK